MDTTQWPQDTALKPMEEIVTNNNTIKGAVGANLERKGGGAIRPPHKKEIEGVNCPRCNSTNTKFCYYNNYSLTQPRYFCKSCKRYWTAGGTLRNIPVGGGSRKNKRSTSTSSSSKKINLDLVNPKINYNLEGHVEGQDLNLGFSKTAQDFKAISELIQVPNFDTKKESFSSAMELLNGISPRGFNSFFPMPIGSDPVYNNGFSLMSDFKPSALSFSLDGLVGNGGGGGGSVYGSLQDVQETTSGMLLFPFEDLKQVSGTTTSATTTNDHNINIEQQQNRDQNGDSNGFWNGVLGGGSW